MSLYDAVEELFAEKKYDQSTVDKLKTIVDELDTEPNTFINIFNNLYIKSYNGDLDNDAKIFRQRVLSQLMLIPSIDHTQAIINAAEVGDVDTISTIITMSNSVDSMLITGPLLLLVNISVTGIRDIRITRNVHYSTIIYAIVNKDLQMTDYILSKLLQYDDVEKSTAEASTTSFPHPIIDLMIYAAIEGGNTHFLGLLLDKIKKLHYMIAAYAICLCVKHKFDNIAISDKLSAFLVMPPDSGDKNPIVELYYKYITQVSSQSVVKMLILSRPDERQYHELRSYLIHSSRHKNNELFATVATRMCRYLQYEDDKKLIIRECANYATGIRWLIAIDNTRV